jgi:hypothetical protein
MSKFRWGFQFNTFPREQSAFPVQSAAKATDLSVRCQHAMAGDQDRNRIRATRAADGPDGLGFADGLCNFAVAPGFTGGDSPEFAPDGLLKFRSAGQIERRQFFYGAPGKEIVQCGFGCAVPVVDLCGNAICLDDSSASAVLRRDKRFRIWKIHFGQALFGITRGEPAVTRRNGEFDKMIFHGQRI